MSIDKIKPEDYSTSENIPSNPLEKQIGGEHYKKFKIQPAVFCYENQLNNLQSEAVSYLCRYKFKNGKQDLEKAIHTLEMLIELEYANKS